MPKAFGSVDADIVRFFNAAAFKDLLIDVAESIEGFALIFFVFVTPGAKVAGKKLLVFLNVVLGDLVRAVLVQGPDESKSTRTMFSTGVATPLGLTVLIFPNARPRRPSPALLMN